MTLRYGHLIHILGICTDQATTAALASMDLTSAQGKIMGYLAHVSQPPCPRDIEQAFHLSHPTVSGLLTRLEKKGFIEFLPDEQDRRSKRIRLLPKGRELHQTMHQIILDTEAQLVQGFSAEEQAQFESLLRRALANMGDYPCKRKQKEESQT